MTALTLTDAVRHHLNPLHVYCRLTPILKIFGIGRVKIREICRAYEERFYGPVLGTSKKVQLSERMALRSGKGAL